MRLANLFDRVTLVGIGIILFQNSVAAGGILGSGKDQPVDQEVKTSGDILEDASSLKLELASLREELADLKAQEESSDNERTKRLDSLAEENRELVQLVHTIASAGNGSYGGTAGDAGKSQSSTEGSPKVELHMTATGGANYIRWGRTTCAGDATVLYTGFAASGGSANSGGTSDIICLHSNPELGDTVAGGTLYSALTILEYQFNGSPFKTTNNRGQPLINNDVPCVMCHVRTRTNQLMIPGRYTCPSGWTSEYWGYLVSTRYSNVKGSILCVDEGPESVNGGSLPASVMLPVYPVEVKCGGSHCPPYGADNEVTCVVCSK